MIRETLAARLGDEDSFNIVGSASTAEEAIDKSMNLKPDIIVMDIDMPGMICFDAARTIVPANPDTHIIFLSAFFHDHYIEQALNVHARGYITKKEPTQTIIEALRTVAGGGTFFSDDVRARLVVYTDGVRLSRKGHTRAAMLTGRELEVLRYIARGMPKKQIAETMFLSVKTVENYCAKLMDKLDIHDRVELTRYAIREGLADA